MDHWAQSVSWKARIVVNKESMPSDPTDAVIAYIFDTYWIKGNKKGYHYGLKKKKSLTQDTKSAGSIEVRRPTCIHLPDHQHALLYLIAFLTSPERACEGLMNFLNPWRSMLSFNLSEIDRHCRTTHWAWVSLLVLWLLSTCATITSAFPFHLYRVKLTVKETNTGRKRETNRHIK